MRRVSMATRDELIAVAGERYRRSGRRERGQILDEFTALTGFHRKHAMRLLSVEREKRSQWRSSGASDLRRGSARDAHRIMGDVGPRLRQALAASGSDPH